MEAAYRPQPGRGFMQSISKKPEYLCYFLTTNSYYVKKTNVLDAIRIRDGIKVVLKRVSATTDEIGITLHLSSAHMRSDPRNRTVHILDVIPIRYNDEEHVFLVMPYLRKFDSPPFHCRSEFVESLRQLLQVCQLDFKYQLIEHLSSSFCRALSSCTNKTSHTGNLNALFYPKAPLTPTN
jgi:hypothetical protein